MNPDLPKLHLWDFVKTILKRWPVQMALLVFFIFVTSFLEGFGFTLFLPLIRLMIGESETVPMGELNGFQRLLDRFHFTHSLILLLAVVIVVVGIRNIFFFLHKRISGKITADLAMDIKRSVIEALYNSDWRFYLKQKVGEVSNVTGHSAHTAANSVQMLSLFLSELLHVSVYFIVGVFMSWEAFSISLVTGAVCFMVARNVIHQSRLVSDLDVRAKNYCQNVVVEELLGYKFIKANQIEKEGLKRLTQIFKKISDVELRAFKYGAIVDAVPDFLMVVMLCLILYVCREVFKVPGENLLVIIMIIYRLNRRVVSLQTARQRLFVYLPYYEFCQSLVQSGTESREITGKRPLTKFQSYLEFRDVSFSYDSKVIVKDLRFKINKNEFVAVVGKTGVGKTTIIDMIVGLLKPTKGFLLIDGEDLQRYDIYSWRRNISYLTQEPFIFNGTVYENIVLCRRTATMADVIRAAKMAHADEFIDKLPKGYDEGVGERGNQLSGGQKQRLALARALLCNPELLIMDEATSSVDGESEKRIGDAISGLKGKLTILMVAHRSKLIDLADCVFTLRAGTITEELTDSGSTAEKSEHANPQSSRILDAA